MQQYFAINKNLDLDAGDYHHIKNVMRMKTGDLIKVAYDNTIYTCKLTKVSNISKFEIVNKIVNDKESLNITIAFSLIKEQKLNYLLQKSTEVGAAQFIPINTIRSVVKIDNKKESSKIDRWNKIVKEASEQSFRSFVPKINSICNLNDLINSSYDVKLLCSLNKNSKNIKKVIKNINKCDRILIVIGPEGGFDPKEEKLLLDNGFLSITLGENVLRAETAPVAAISMINYEFMR